MRRRETALWFAAPYALSLFVLITGMPVWPVSLWPVFLLLSLGVVFIAMLPLAVSVFRLVEQLHGFGYGVAHVIFLFALTPTFLVGLLFIPIVVHGDAARLLDDD